MNGFSERSRVGLAAAWAVALLVVAVAPGDGGSLAGSGPLGLVGVDRWLHAVGDGTLAGLVSWATAPAGRREYVAVLAVAAGYGCLTELLQAPLATRTADPLDALANAVGAGVVVVLWYAVRRSRRPTLERDGSSETDSERR